MSEDPLTKARLSIGALKTFVATQLARGDATGKNSSPKNCAGLLAQASIIEKLIRCFNKLDQLQIDMKTVDSSELEEASSRPLQRARPEIEDDVTQLLCEWQSLDWELTNAMANDRDLRSHDEGGSTVRRKLFSWRNPTIKSLERSKAPAISITVGEALNEGQENPDNYKGSPQSDLKQQYDPGYYECSPQNDLQGTLDPAPYDTSSIDDGCTVLHSPTFSPDDEVLAGWLRALESLSSSSGINQD